MATTPTPGSHIALPTCYDYTVPGKYFCNWGYSCCGTRSCCLDNYHNHGRFASSQWFWVVWATMIILVCCCSYIRRRQAAGEGVIPVAFYRNIRPRRRIRTDGQESEEELLPPAESAGGGNGVFFLPPGSGDQTQLGAECEWYRANKPPPYSLVSSHTPGVASSAGADAASGTVQSPESVAASAIVAPAAAAAFTATPADSTSAAAVATPLAAATAVMSSIQFETVQSTLGGTSSAADCAVATSQTASVASSAPGGDLLGPPPSYSNN